MLVFYASKEIFLLNTVDMTGQTVLLFTPADHSSIYCMVDCKTPTRINRQNSPKKYSLAAFKIKSGCVQLFYCQSCVIKFF